MPASDWLMKFFNKSSLGTDGGNDILWQNNIDGLNGKVYYTL